MKPWSAISSKDCVKKALMQKYWLTQYYVEEKCPIEPSSIESTIKHQRRHSYIIKTGITSIVFRTVIHKSIAPVSKLGQLPSLIGSANHKGTCFISSSGMSFGGFSESYSLCTLQKYFETHSRIIYVPFAAITFLLSHFLHLASVISPFLLS